MIRVNHGTVHRPHLMTRPQGYALEAETCSHGVSVVQFEPVVLLGSVVEQDEHGKRRVDLSGAEWHPHSCLES